MVTCALLSSNFKALIGLTPGLGFVQKNVNVIVQRAKIMDVSANVYSILPFSVFIHVLKKFNSVLKPSYSNATHIFSSKIKTN